MRLNESVIRDIELTLSNHAQRCRDLLSLLDDESDFGKIALRHIEQMVRDCIGDSGLPSGKQKVVVGETIDVPAL